LNSGVYVLRSIAISDASGFVGVYTAFPLSTIPGEGQGEDPARRQREADRAELAGLKKKVETVGKNMALAETREERDATAAVFRELKARQAALEQRLAADLPATNDGTPEREVAAALAVLDRLTEVAGTDADWRAAGTAFATADAKLYLRFAEVAKGRQTFNVPAGGVVTFGSAPPPAPLYTGPTDRAIIRKMLAAGEPVTASPAQSAPGDSDAGQDVIGSANVQRGTRRCSRPRLIGSSQRSAS
jgi:hypothetical protein